MLYIEFTTESIGILASAKEPRIEYAYWVRDEWVEDSEIVFAIANAIRLALTDEAAFILKANGRCKECARHGDFLVLERDEDGLYCEMCQPSPGEET